MLILTIDGMIDGTTAALGLVQPAGIGPGDGAGIEVAPSSPGGAVPGGPGGPAKPPGMGLMWMILPAMLLVLMMSMGGQRKEKKQRAALIAGLHKHDVVQTSGGMIGTISEIRDKEVVLKIDDASPMRVRFTKSSILHVVRAHGSTGSTPETNTDPESNNSKNSKDTSEAIASGAISEAEAAAL